MNKRVCMNSRAQSQISFGMIFAIILIIIFIAFAIYGINKFLATSRLVQIESFKSDLQSDIDKMYRSPQGSQIVGPYLIPRKIKQICFKDDPKENLYFEPDDYDGDLLNNIDMDKTLGHQTKLCIDSPNGKVSMTIKKAFTDRNGVTITR